MRRHGPVIARCTDSEDFPPAVWTVCNKYAAGTVFLQTGTGVCFDLLSVWNHSISVKPIGFNNGYSYRCVFREEVNSTTKTNTNHFDLLTCRRRNNR